MIGSETFIMVAFRWADSSTPCCLASSIWAATKLRRAFWLMTEASMISPARTAVFSLRTLLLPSAAISSIFTLPAASIRAPFSLP
ncbi:hypothetical protein D3C85_1069970 [compost metagenome]